jgi:hypothetical protein
MIHKSIEERRDIFLKTLKKKLAKGIISSQEYEDRCKNIELTYTRLKKQVLTQQATY